MEYRNLRIALVSISMLAAGLCLQSCSSTTGPEDDPTAPTPVFDLAVSATTDTTVTLTWTATGDDELVGRATRYELRRSDEFIAPLTWDAATPVSGLPRPKPPGNTETFTVTGLEPDSTYFFALKVYDEEGNTGGVGNCVEAVCITEAVIDVPDTNLAAAIRDQLSLPPGPLYRSDLRSLVDLDASDRGILDLTGIEECRALVFLRLHGNQITDLSPLAGLTKMYDLSVAINDIADLSPLAGMSDLGHLWADYNRIADLSPLAELGSLTVLRIQHNLISDLEPLAGMTGLEELALGENSLGDTGPLAGLTGLKVLTMNTTGLSDLGFVMGMSQLAVLHAGNNQISDLTPVSGLPQLEYLQFSYNLITDLAPLVANDGLGAGDTVLVRENPLSDTALNEQIPALVARGVNVDFLE